MKTSRLGALVVLLAGALCFYLGAHRNVETSGEIDTEAEPPPLPRTSPPVVPTPLPVQPPSPADRQTAASTPTSSPPPVPAQSVEEARKIAAARYPALNRPDSAFSTEFGQLLLRYRQAHPEIFTAPNWPFQLADEVAQKLNVRPVDREARGATGRGVPAADRNGQYTSPSTNDFAAYSSSLVIIQGNAAVGSGFLGNVAGHPCIFTNAHVISGNANPTFRLLSGEDVLPGRFAVATNADVATFTVDEKYPGLKMCARVDSDVQVGDEVLVLGNSAGKEVATELRGVVKGIGPRKIEVDAEFVTGNRGSPVILIRTGEVIGIATEVYTPVLDKITQNSPFRSLRRFAYRVDVVDKWDMPTVSAFDHEAALLATLKEHTEELLFLAQDIAINKIPTINAQNKRLNYLSLAVRDYYAQAGGMKSKNRVLNSTDPEQQLLLRMIFESTADINLTAAPIKTGYHRGVLEEEMHRRSFLKDALNKLLTQ